MSIISSGRLWLEFIHYSRVLFCCLAITSTATCAIVLLDFVPWQPILIAGLGTYIIYTGDNILDWSGEQHLLKVLHPVWKSYLIWSAITIPLALVVIAILGWQGGVEFLALLGGLGVISAAQVIEARQLHSRNRSVSSLWIERLTDSLMWSLVIVLLPVQYTRLPIVPQVFMAIAYAWHLSWINVMIWDLTLSATGGHKHNTRSLASILGEYHTFKLLQIISMGGAALAIIDVLLGYFPWYNIFVICAPLLNLALLKYWRNLRRFPRIYGGLFPIANIISNLLVLTAYFAAID